MSTYNALFYPTHFRTMLEKRFPSIQNMRFISDQTLYCIFMDAAKGRGLKIINSRDLTRYEAVAKLVNPLNLYTAANDPTAPAKYLIKQIDAMGEERHAW